MCTRGPHHPLVDDRSSLRAMRGLAGVKIEGRFWNMTPSSYLLCEDVLGNNCGIADGSLIFVKRTGLFFGVSYSRESLHTAVCLTFQMLKPASPNLLLHLCLHRNCLCETTNENTLSQIEDFKLHMCFKDEQS